MIHWRMVGAVPLGNKYVYSEEKADQDKLACKAIHEKQVERYGKDVVGDEPDLTAFPIRLALVAEENGKVVDYMYFEQTIEFCMGGVSAKAAASLRRIAPALIQELKQDGFRLMRTFVPKDVVKEITKPVVRAGFKQQPDYEQFLLDMR